ncbi:MAG TPA: tetratricopeptide repeat protein [Methylophilaceae bacterium]|jgi:tetratricopeptide (TPR) repeat protein
MPVYRALPYLLVLLSLFFTFSSAQADELKDIAQQASQGQQAAALDRINTYLSNNPKDVQAMFIRGVILAEQGRRDEATKAFVDITEKYPNLPEPYNNLAVLYADQGQYDKARKALETAIKTHPSYATAHENLGDIYARMASEAYDKALQLDTSNTRAQGKLSLIKELFSSTGKPVLLANNAADNTSTKQPVKEPVKEASKSSLPPALPIRPAEASKPAEPIKPAEPVKAIEPAKPAEPIKPAEIKSASSTKPAKSTAGDDSKDVAESVKQWAKAWSSKNVDKYLASYADNFQTPDAQPRKEWEDTRRDRISKPASINVDLSNIQVKMEDDSHARVSFKQSYRAGKVSMRAAKSLVLKKSAGKWLIEQELTDH